MHPPAVSVLMPTYAQAAFIERALASLLAQTFTDWEAVVVDANPDDETARRVAPWLGDARLCHLRIAEGGLGRALNTGLDHTSAPLVAYLPSDDVWYAEHLAHLHALLQARPDAVLAHSGVRHHYNREAAGAPPGEPLQLVQCLHRRVDARWTGRDELESDDLERLYWRRLRERGAFVGHGRASCEWVEHPKQRHRLMREPVGGIAPFRQHYRVQVPLRFHSTAGPLIDEVAQYRTMRERPPTRAARSRLKILLVGELAYNADRVLALEEAGHELHGLWMREPYWYNTVGPLPFGHVHELADHRGGTDDGSTEGRGWREAVDALRPDLVYALLNWQAVPFAHEVLQHVRGRIPFVWHFKEGPFICLEKGSWPQLVELHRDADGQIFSSPEMRDWFDTVVPGLCARKPTFVLDGDLPKRDWFDAGPRSERLSLRDGEIHTVVPGRPIGLHPPDVAELGARGIHLHFYGDFTHGQWREWIDKVRSLAPDHLHLHANVAQDGWLREFSRYDAGWLHAFRSANGGELRRANWDDLNYPARMATLACAGLPMIQRANRGHVVATQTLCHELGIGVFYQGFDDLAATLRDEPRMAALRASVWSQRERFCFDSHVPALLRFFRQVAGRDVPSTVVANATKAPVATLEEGAS